MASELRVNTSTNRVGLGTITYTDTGPIISGITTGNNFKTGTSNLHSTGLNVFDLDVDGHTNLDNVSIAGVTTTTGNVNIAHGTGQAHYQITQTNGNTVKFGIVSGSDIELSGSSNNSMYFKTNNTERLRIDSSGHMGLGITPSDIDSIGRALNIASSTGGAIYLQDTDAPTTKFAAISYNGGTAALQIHAHHGSSYIDLGTNGTERVRITSSGDVGIGYNSPTVKLHVREAASGFSGTYDNRYHIIMENDDEAYLGFYVPDNQYAGIRFHDTTGLEGYIDYYFGTDAMHYVSTDHHLFKTAGTERLRINSGGLVGINHNTSGASTNAPLTIQNSTGSSATRFNLVNSGSSGVESTQIWSQNNDLAFNTAGTERLRINSDGRALFDRGAPASANKTIARFQCESSRRLDLVWHDSGSLMGFDTPSSHAYTFKVGGTEKMRLENLGDSEWGIKFLDSKAIEFKSQQQGIFTLTWSISANTWTNFFSIPDYFQGWLFLNGTHNAGNSSALWSISKSPSGGAHANRFAHDNLYSPASVTFRINGVWVQINSSYATYGYATLITHGGGNSVANLSG